MNDNDLALLLLFVFGFVTLYSIALGNKLDRIEKRLKKAFPFADK